MFSHIMVGSNDIARSKKFYDALFVAMGGQPAVVDPKGRLAYTHNGGRFMVSQADRRQAGLRCQWRDDRIHDERCQTGRRLAQSRRRERRHVDRRPTGRAPGRHRSDLSRIPSRSGWQQAVRASSHAGCVKY
jgi:hypothetical protein